MPRDDFSDYIKRRLAQRAGYACSICNRITVGPSEESPDSVNLTGVAAHISAASPGGRRYDHSMTVDQRTGIENGIWLCTTHADLIDGDASVYTIPALERIKKNHEEKIRIKQSGIGIEKGVITKIELSNFGLIADPVSLDFTDRNIIMGSNGVGKTLICEMIASLSKKKYLNRWTKKTRLKRNSFCDIYYFKNQLDKFSISIDRDGQISYAMNGSDIPILVPPIHIVYIKDSYWNFLQKVPEQEREERSLVDLLSAYFKLTKDEFISIVSNMEKSKKYFMNDISLNNDKDDIMVITSGGRGFGLRFGALSTGEQERVLLEIALKIAGYYAKFNTTILLVESTSFGTIDSAGINHLLNIIRTEEMNFQFFLTLLQNTGYNLVDFKVHTLVKNKAGVVTVEFNPHPG